MVSGHEERALPGNQVLQRLRSWAELLDRSVHHVANDRHEIRVNNWIEPWDFASPIDVGIISVPFSKTSILPNGAHGAPNALRDAWAIFTTFTPDSAARSCAAIRR